MDLKSPTLLLLTEDTELAQKLVRALDECGVLAYWIEDDEEAEKLAEIWDVRGWLIDVGPTGMN